MPRRKTIQPPPAAFVAPMTPNQVVAFNLAWARGSRGWTQEEAARALEPYIGALWSKGTFSAAERSVDGDRVRQFTADEIVAFARTFELPIGWFFMPPPGMNEDGDTVVLLTPDGGPTGVTPAELVDVVFGYGEGATSMALRLDRFLHDLGVMRFTKVQQAMRKMVQARVNALVRASLGPLADLRTAMRAIEHQLGDIEYQASRAALQATDEDSTYSARGGAPS